jgi:F-type H+-transporting ATPase subunit b
VLIEPFTVIAQIVNFLILVFLLRRFLYGPIVKMMNERRERIEADLTAAERKRQEARAEIETYQRKNEELDAQREELLDQAKQAADSERHRLLTAAREEAETSRARWRQALEEEKETFLLDLRRRIGEHSYRVMRRALTDLADAELEERITAVFLRRLSELSDKEKDLLLENSNSGKGSLAVHTAFELPDAARKEIAAQLSWLSDNGRNLQFSLNPDLIGGLELQAAGHKVAWSLDSYLDELEEEMRKELVV